jgi:hypothetical protein
MEDHPDCVVVPLADGALPSDEIDSGHQLLYIGGDSERSASGAWRGSSR